MKKSFVASFAVTALLVVASSQAFAAASAAETSCRAEWAGMKKSNTTPAGAVYNKWFSDCVAKANASAAKPTTTTTAAKPAATAPAATTAKPAPTAPAATAAKPTTTAPATTTTAAKPGMAPATGGKAGEQARIKACGVEWAAFKKTPKFDKAKDKWPQFWSACNTRLKAAGK